MDAGVMQAAASGVSDTAAINAHLVADGTAHAMAANRAASTTAP